MHAEEHTEPSPDDRRSREPEKPTVHPASPDPASELPETRHDYDSPLNTSKSPETELERAMETDRDRDEEITTTDEGVSRSSARPPSSTMRVLRAVNFGLTSFLSFADFAAGDTTGGLLWGGVALLWGGLIAADYFSPGRGTQG